MPIDIANNNNNNNNNHHHHHHHITAEVCQTSRQFSQPIDLLEVSFPHVMFPIDLKIRSYRFAYLTISDSCDILFYCMYVFCLCLIVNLCEWLYQTPINEYVTLHRTLIHILPSNLFFSRHSFFTICLMLLLFCPPPQWTHHSLINFSSLDIVWQSDCLYYISDNKFRHIDIPFCALLKKLCDFWNILLT